jgi:hypothetical protein
MKQKYFLVLAILGAVAISLLYFLSSKNSDSVSNKQIDVSRVNKIADNSASDTNIIEAKAHVISQNRCDSNTKITNALGGELDDLQFTDGAIEQVMNAPIMNNLPDISIFEEDFETAI